MNPLDFTLSAKIEILNTKLNFNTPNLVVNGLSWQHRAQPTVLSLPLVARRIADRSRDAVLKYFPSYIIFIFITKFNFLSNNINNNNIIIIQFSIVEYKEMCNMLIIEN